MRTQSRDTIYRKMNSFEKTVLTYLIVLFITVESILIIIWILTPPYNGPDHIEVNGKLCEIRYKIDGCNSTGACSSHKIAVCGK